MLIRSSVVEWKGSLFSYCWNPVELLRICNCLSYFTTVKISFTSIIIIAIIIIIIINNIIIIITIAICYSLYFM